MKKLFYTLAVCCLLLTGCGDSGNVAERPVEDGVDYDVIVVGGDRKGSALRFPQHAMG